MCGIAGFCDFNKRSNLDILIKMTDTLYHRGPDDKGYEFLETTNAHIGLGNRRLSVIDLSLLGRQPMKSSNGDCTIIYNGEVYNFMEIKHELEQKGFSFRSLSDTEVILNAFIQWGVEAVHKFIGMFAFVIYDKRVGKIYIFRDRAGVKPLFYFWKNDLLLLASELKSFQYHPNFKKEIDTNSLPLYLQYGYIPAPYSIFRNTYKLKPGHFLEIDLNNKTLYEKKYWDVLDYYNRQELNISEAEAIEETEKLLKSAFEYRLVADVPVGLFLSGGYDSSTVGTLLQRNRAERIKTFTIGFSEKGFDEAPYAKRVAKYLGTDHTEYYCSQKDALEIIPSLPDVYDEPFGDSSVIPTILVSRLSRKSITVALSADGGDEVFGGYNKYIKSVEYLQIIQKLPKAVRQIILKVLKNINPNYIPFLQKTYNFDSRFERLKMLLTSESCVSVMKIISQLFTDEQLKHIFKKRFSPGKTFFDDDVLLNISNNQFNNMLAIDYKTYMMDDILVKVDRATMSASLEGREPFLDHRVIEFIAQLPSNLKFRNGKTKCILRNILYKYLPKGLMERPKMGFAVPIVYWFKGELKQYLLQYLDKKRLEKNEIFEVDEIIKLRDDYLGGRTENIHKLWFLLMFEMWHERWI